jgi:HK97 family phage prohead protease
MQQMKKLAKPFEVKNLESDGTFTGYGSVFGNTDSYGDVVEKGAFEKSLETHRKAGRMPALLWQHNHAEPIGVWQEMSEDDHGLLVKGRLLIDDDPLAKRAYAHLKAGSVGGLSIGYSVDKNGGEWDDEDGVYRLKQVTLWETSLVTFPANQEAQVQTVKAADFIDDIRGCEIFLRDAGFSRSQAKSLLAGGFKGLTGQRDAETEAGEAQKAADLINEFLTHNFK